MKTNFNFLRFGWFFLGLLFCDNIFGQVELDSLERDSLIEVYEELVDKMETAFEEGRYLEALPISEKVVEQCLSLFGNKNNKYIFLVNTRAVILKETGSYTDALALFEDVLQLAHEECGINDTLSAKIENDLGMLLIDLNRYDEALPLMIKSLENAKTNAPQSGIHGLRLNNIGFLYTKKRDFDKAMNFSQKALEVIALSLGKKHKHYSTALNNLAHLHSMMGMEKEAYSYHCKALEATEVSLGKEHPDYGVCLSNLAVWNLEMGNFEIALNQAIEAKKITEETQGKRNSPYAIRLATISLIYNKTSKFKAALSYALESLEITQAVLGKNHSDYCSRLSNVAIMYEKLRQYEKAIEYAEKSVTCSGESMGMKHPRYAVHLNNLAIQYYRTGQNEKAETLFLKSLDIAKESIGENSISYGTKLLNIASFYQRIGNYENSKLFFSRGLDLYLNLLGSNNSDYSDFSYAYLRVLRHANDMQEFSKVFSATMDNDMYNIKHKLPFVSETIQERWSKYYLCNFEICQSHIYLGFGNSEEKKFLTFFFLLRNFQLSSKSELLRAIKRADNETQKKYRIWHNNKSYLARQLTLPIAKRNPDIDSVTQATENLENSIALKSKDFTAARNGVELEDIQHKLQAEEALLQFSHYRYNNGYKWTDSTLYAAYLVYPDKNPEIVYLLEQKQLDSLISQQQQLEVGRGTGDGIKPLRNNQYFNLIWKPILPHLAGVKILYVSSSGSLHKVNLGAIPIDSSTIVSDLYELNYIISTRSFVRPQEEKYHNTALILGGLDYDKMNTKNITLRGSSQDFMQYDTTFQTSEKKFGPLKGAKAEALTIAKSLAKKQFKVNCLTGDQGTEMAIKQIGADSIASPRLLHIATHGYALPNLKKKQADNSLKQGQNAYRLAEDPLIRTGLLLAGSNSAWLGKATPAGEEDGILTAYEIAHLDFSDTELVVLSACDTGLGDIQGTEGVYGLQRAFKMAGVKYIIMSLQAVPDAETQELMELFYQNWLEDKITIPDAFRMAQDEMRKRYSGERWKWAGFVLVE